MKSTTEERAEQRREDCLENPNIKHQPVNGYRECDLTELEVHDRRIPQRVRTLFDTNRDASHDFDRFVILGSNANRG